jgi:hypothetical protein
MFVEVRQERGRVSLYVMGAKLVRHPDDFFWLPGRLVAALKPADLPAGIRFAIEDHLPSGRGFYREDRVAFQRDHDSARLLVEVTSQYDPQAWDGIFPLSDTLRARQSVIIGKRDLQVTAHQLDTAAGMLYYQFYWPASGERDLETVLDSLCDTVCALEAEGNARLWYGAVWGSGETE